jgi:hypothetical protein
MKYFVGAVSVACIAWFALGLVWHFETLLNGKGVSGGKLLIDLFGTLYYFSILTFIYLRHIRKNRGRITVWLNSLALMPPAIVLVLLLLGF